MGSGRNSCFSNVNPLVNKPTNKTEVIPSNKE